MREEREEREKPGACAISNQQIMAKVGPSFDDRMLRRWARRCCTEGEIEDLSGIRMQETNQLRACSECKIGRLGAEEEEKGKDSSFESCLGRKHLVNQRHKTLCPIQVGNLYNIR